eukprot:gene3898-7778_t
MSRVTKDKALSLIKYAKAVSISANYWDPKSKSAFEFARQISSPKLKKANPAFSVKFDVHERNEEGFIIAEFANKQKWETTTSGFKASELRSEFFVNAEVAETTAELAGEVDHGTEDKFDQKGASKGAAKAAPGGKGGKK